MEDLKILYRSKKNEKNLSLKKITDLLKIIGSLEKKDPLERDLKILLNETKNRLEKGEKSKLVFRKKKYIKNR